MSRAPLRYNLMQTGIPGFDFLVHTFSRFDLRRALSCDRRGTGPLMRLACLVITCLTTSSLCAATVAVDRARALYLKTEYHASLQVLEKEPTPDGAAYDLIGKNYFALDDYEKAVQYFEKARAAEPNNSDHYLWLGRAWGRRAETASFFAAPGRASKARQNFETAVMLDPKNSEAMNDLFDFYINAPGFIGGGVEKAEAIARRIEHERPAEYQHELALLAEHRKQHEEALEHLRKARIELAPTRRAGCWTWLVIWQSWGAWTKVKRCFDRPKRKWPTRPEVIFAHAKFYVDAHREPQRARQLLEKYLNAQLTPDDVTKQQAEKLMHQVANR